MAESAAADAIPILVVDDSVAIRKILKGMLQASDLRVIEAGDGAQAVELCRIDRPGLVLLDIDMPVMDGLDALAVIKADPDLCTIPVLMLTARTSGSDVVRALELGAQDYVRKPCDPRELLARVRVALSLHARERQLIERADELSSMSTTDPLTGAGNRRSLTEHLATLRNHVGEHGNVGLMLADIDHFKSVNDVYGHAAGDDVLCEIADRMRALLGPACGLIRWGGEEFLVVCESADDLQLRSLAEQMRRAIETEPVRTQSRAAIYVTVSIGCASGPLSQAPDVLRRADEAMYVAKSQGRNSVVLSSL